MVISLITPNAPKTKTKTKMPLTDEIFDSRFLKCNTCAYD